MSTVSWLINCRANRHMEEKQKKKKKMKKSMCCKQSQHIQTNVDSTHVLIFYVFKGERAGNPCSDGHGVAENRSQVA